MKKKPVKTKAPPRHINRFIGALIECPRCFTQVIISKFIINIGVNGQPGCFLTCACSNCSDVVQVAMGGESQANVVKPPSSWSIAVGAPSVGDRLQRIQHVRHGYKTAKRKQ